MDNKQKFTEQTSEIKDSSRKFIQTSKIQNSEVGFQTKYKNKGKICQIKESAQVTEESDTDNEDSTKIKTEETEAPIFPKITIMGSRPSRSKKTREYDLGLHDSCLRKLKENTPQTAQGKKFYDKSPFCKDGSSDNNETQKSIMDKIIAQGNVPYVPRRNRPAPPPPDVLD
jgi:hypothetical protein